jgi:putative hydrolase of HD superfamily
MDKIDIPFDGRFMKQLNFIIEIDKIKNVLRQSRSFDGSRFENDAEHSWTIAIMAMLFKEYAACPVNIDRVIPMLLVHDIVEADAGDTFLYDAARDTAHEREAKAADRLFGLLEDDQRGWFRGLWDEYEAQETNEARFAEVFDRLEPLLQNFVNEGYTWKQHGVTSAMVRAKSEDTYKAAPFIGDFFNKLLDAAVERGYLKP